VACTGRPLTPNGLDEPQAGQTTSRLVGFSGRLGLVGEVVKRRFWGIGDWVPRVPRFSRPFSSEWGRRWFRKAEPDEGEPGLEPETLIRPRPPSPGHPGEGSRMRIHAELDTPLRNPSPGHPGEGSRMRIHAELDAPLRNPSPGHPGEGARMRIHADWMRRCVTLPPRMGEKVVPQGGTG
jgi:hypothetical protein